VSQEGQQNIMIGTQYKRVQPGGGCGGGAA